MDSFNPPTFMVGGPLEELEVDPEGNLHLLKASLLGPGRARFYWLELDRTGQVLDSTFVLPGETVGSVDPTTTLSALSPKGYVVSGRTDQYVLFLHREEGVVQIRHEWEPVEYKREERREKQFLAEVMSDRTGRPEGRIGQTKPAFKALFVDSEGRFWIERYAEGHNEGESPGEESRRLEGCRFMGASRAECDKGIRTWHDELVFDVLGTEGTYIGTLRFPTRRTKIWHAAGSTLWVTEQNEYDESFVVRYRIERP
ncbi:MAG: hypothetical protein R3E98_18645 [Gemmatimonadota bacterium]